MDFHTQVQVKQVTSALEEEEEVHLKLKKNLLRRVTTVK